MRVLRRFVLIVFFFAASGFSVAVQSAEAWLPIAPHDMQVKGVPGNPGAAAIQLYLSHYKACNDHFVSVHKSEGAYSYLNQVDATVHPKKKGNLMELELENVPAFNAEEYMPPEDDYKPAVLFYYGGRETASPEKFWEEWQRLITEYVEKFTGNSGAVRDAAAQAVGSEADPEKKLRKLYARAQQIRNLSFERTRTKEDQKGAKLKTNNNAQDVLQHGYGTRWEIDALLVALARAAGFEASMLGVTDRHERSFTKLLLWLGAVGGQAALVEGHRQELTLASGITFSP